ncbi:MAG: sulfatase-like hydrolase/transferase, partial [Bacteroidetes bacterium]|nr:sulfatase-like hydrolase/transferase [Bacteroidota bacterium]
MLSSILRPLVRSVLFWLGLFLLQSLLFLFFAWSGYSGTLWEAALSLWHGLRMHVATASILSFPWFAGGVWVLLSPKHAASVSAVLKIWMWIALGVVCTVGSADMALFHAWGSKLNLQALEYLHYPREAMVTIFDASNLLYAGAAFGLFLFGFLILRRLNLRIEPGDGKPNRVVLSVSLLFIAGLFLISARGGVKSEVLNRNHVFRSGHSVLNYTALNSFWNFMDLLMAPGGKSARYTFFPVSESEVTVLQMQQVQDDSTVQVVFTGKPNVIIVMLESWGSDAVECVGGEKGVAPHFSQLADEGLLFNRFFASGTRTEQGLLAVLSGMPARPVGSAIQSFGTFDHLPNLYNVFNKRGYQTSYYYGGRLSFDNVEAYLRSAGVQHMVGIQEVNPQRKTKWGAYDEEV